MLNPISFVASAECESITEYNVEDIIEFGSYPQSLVTDSELVSLLNNQSGLWQSYEYYSGTGYYDDGKMTASTYMRFKDIVYNNEKYRAVIFDSYRPYLSGSNSSINEQQSNGFLTENTYWFKFEPIRWIVFNPKLGIIMCENIIDSQPFNNYIIKNGIDFQEKDAYWGNVEQTYYANNYAQSSLRVWLNNDFYNTAFSTYEQSKIIAKTRENKAFSLSYSEYDSDVTTDKISLLSWDDVINTSYGFSSNASDYDITRRAHGTDYAKCQGLYTYAGYQTDLGEDTSAWWLRSSGYISGTSCGVSCPGIVSYGDFASLTSHGIRPILKLIISSEDYELEIEKESAKSFIEALIPLNITENEKQIVERIKAKIDSAESIDELAKALNDGKRVINDCFTNYSFQTIKENAKNAIDDATPTDSSQIIKNIAAEAKAEIENANTIQEIETIKQNGIDAINAQIKKEQDEAEAAKMLDDAKSAAKAELDSLANGKSDAVKVLAKIAKQNIEIATDVAEVSAAKQEGIIAINAQIKKEQDEKNAEDLDNELKSSQEKAIFEINSKVDAECSSKVKSIRDNAIKRVTSAKNIDEVNNIKEKAIKDIISQRQEDCSYCGHEHSSFFGWLIKFFHSILSIFGNKYTG